MTVHMKARRIAEHGLLQLPMLTTAELSELATFIDAAVDDVADDDASRWSSRQALIDAITGRIQDPRSTTVLFRFIAGLREVQGQRPPRELYRLQARRERPFHRPCVMG